MSCLAVEIILLEKVIFANWVMYMYMYIQLNFNLLNDNYNTREYNNYNYVHVHEHSFNLLNDMIHMYITITVMYQ